ncbi:MAG: PAS domain S-box protein [Planctomycetota bacterium]
MSDANASEPADHPSGDGADPWLNLLCELVPGMVAYVDAGGRIRFANRLLKQWFGDQSIVGHAVAELAPGQDSDAWRRGLTSALEGRETVYDARLPNPQTGDMHTLRVHCVPHVDGAGTVRGLVALSTDITDREHAAEELRQSEERHRKLIAAVLGTAIDAIVTIDEKGRILSVNPATERMFGYRAAELVGHNVRMLMPSPYADEHDGYIERFRTTGERRIIGIGREVTGKRRDGTTFPLELAVSEAHWDDHVCFAGFMRDLTDRKQLEAELLQAQKMEAVGRLASGIAHDFNNLLMGVIACCKMAVEHLQAGHPARALIEDASGEAERGTGLVRQLLTFSRKQRISPRPIDLNDVVQRTQVMIGQLVGEDIDLQVTLHAPRSPIVADPTQVEQVIVNLVVNARDAMPTGGRLAIQTDIVHFDEREPRLDRRNKTFVVLSVEDSGIGMSPDTMQHIFEPFFTTKGPKQGTGLGLSTVYGIVQQLKGRIEVESEPGRGTQFSIFLPQSAEAPATTPPPGTSTTASGLPPREGRQELVLLVEDETLVRASLRHTLTKHGYRVLAAADASEALDLAAEHNGEIDVVLTDIVMPGKSGPELVTELRRRQPEISALYMSAYENETLVEQGRLRPGEPTLQKPFTDELLLVKLHDVLG